jgi:hypothetical protein
MSDVNVLWLQRRFASLGFSTELRQLEDGAWEARALRGPTVIMVRRPSRELALRALMPISVLAEAIATEDVDAAAVGEAVPA